MTAHLTALALVRETVSAQAQGHSGGKGLRVSLRRGQSGGGFGQLLGEFLMFPVTVFITTMEVFLNGMRGLQSIMDQGVEAASQAAPEEWPGPAEGGDHTCYPVTPTNATAQGAVSTDISGSNQKEHTAMGGSYGNDDDLGGDDLKVVRWRIIFTKRDYEVTLDQGNEVITYPTTGGSLGGIKVSDFVKAAKDGNRAKTFRRLRNKKYQPKGTAKSWEVPADDMRFVRFLYEVIDRVSKEDDDYERRKVQALENIAKELS